MDFIELTVDNMIVRIGEEDNGDHVYINDDGDSIFGLFEYKNLKIYLHKSLSAQVKRKTLAHELMHCLLYIRGYSTDFTEESVCDLVSSVASYISELVDEYFTIRG